MKYERFFILILKEFCYHCLYHDIFAQALTDKKCDDTMKQLE